MRLHFEEMEHIRQQGDSVRNDHGSVVCTTAASATKRRYRLTASEHRLDDTSKWHPDDLAPTKAAHLATTTHAIAHQQVSTLITS